MSATFQILFHDIEIPMERVPAEELYGTPLDSEFCEMYKVPKDEDGYYEMRPVYPEVSVSAFNLYSVLDLLGLQYSEHGVITIADFQKIKDQINSTLFQDFYFERKCGEILKLIEVAETLNRGIIWA